MLLGECSARRKEPATDGFVAVAAVERHCPQNAALGLGPTVIRLGVHARLSAGTLGRAFLCDAQTAIMRVSLIIILF